MLRAALFMALVAGTPANAAMVSYEYVFHPANPEVSVIYHGPFGVDGPMIASQYSSPGYWSDPDLTFGFRYHGDLAGKTFDLKTLLEAPPVGFEDVYFYSEALTYPFPGYLTPQGFVTFGGTSEVTAWYFSAHGWRPFEHSSEPIPLDLGMYPWSRVINAQDFADLVHYGHYELSGLEEFGFWARPGRWSLSAEVVAVPLPASGLLLLSATFGLLVHGLRNGFGKFSNVSLPRSKCAAARTVRTGGALIGLGALRRFRSRADA